MAHHGDSSPTSSFDHLLADDPGDRRGLRIGLLAAACVHLVVFAITWPTLARDGAAAADAPVRIYPLRIVQFQPPPPPSFERPQVPRRQIPIPDASPHDPEPLVRPEPRLTIDIDPTQSIWEPVDPPPPVEPQKTIVDALVEVDPPVVLVRIQPRYTEAAVRAKIQGAVILTLIIDPNGKVTSVSVLKGLPLGLTESAIEAARQWEFEPCTFNDRPVSVRFNLTIHFRLE